ncbi:MAG: hypothetical protein Q9199_002570 [Rusavskia elegans]
MNQTSDQVVNGDVGLRKSSVTAVQQRKSAYTAANQQFLRVTPQHATDWDRDQDSIIWSQDTNNDCRDYGWGNLLSLIATMFIYIGLPYPTAPSILADPFFRINFHRLYKVKHGSNSGTYDNQGQL